ncbi:hypothetical protein TNCV_2928821 [Trichonephila clavipes]|nr:hypothetical protein TNCV_2928821 [Trichonephila clavipes]
MARVSQDYLRTVTTLLWPARSPDLSPIEDIRDHLELRVGHPTSLNELEANKQDSPFLRENSCWRFPLRQMQSIYPIIYARKSVMEMHAGSLGNGVGDEILRQELVFWWL